MQVDVSEPMLTQEKHEGPGFCVLSIQTQIECPGAASELGSTAPAKKLKEAGFIEMGFFGMILLHAIDSAVGNMGLFAMSSAG